MNSLSPSSSIAHTGQHLSLDSHSSINLEWDPPSLVDMTAIPLGSTLGDNDFRLFHIAEISEGKADAYRLAMANVISGLSHIGCAGVYLLNGRPDGISLYVGVVRSGKVFDAPDMGKSFRTAFEGNFLGAKLAEVKQGELQKLQAAFANNRHLALVTGVPSFNEDESGLDDEDFQGVERLVNSLIGEHWQLTIVATPGSDETVRNTLDLIYQLSTELSRHQKKSIQHSENEGESLSRSIGLSDSTSTGTSSSDTQGSNKSVSESKGSNEGRNSRSGIKNSGINESRSFSDGTSFSRTTGNNNSLSHSTNESTAKTENRGKGIAITQELTDKRAESMQTHLSETLIKRFQEGRSKGMFQTAIYLSAPNRLTFQRLSGSVLSIFQGNQANTTPLHIQELPISHQAFSDVLQLRHYRADPVAAATALVHSLPLDRVANRLSAATWLNAREIALIAGLPNLELPGLKIRKSVDFALNTPEVGQEEHVLQLGKIIQHGRPLAYKSVNLPRKELNKHVFITGVTGAGKTTTCLRLLLESGLPFLVIEPAKTEYRALHAHDPEVDYYVLGREDLSTFRLNPFELVSPKQHLLAHISTLKATLNAVFPMEAAMPQIVEEAIIRAYKNKGWDINHTINFLEDDPWDAKANAWPTFADMIHELDAVIESKKMGTEFAEKYRGSLVARLSSLTLGVKGCMLNTRRSMDFTQLLDKKIVIELDELKDEDDKALFMGLIIGRLAECMKHRHREMPDFQHLTLIEEAHRLLSRPEPGEGGSKKMGVDMFANLLAEVRKYGEGLIIADQIPNKLVADVIKNTNTKIVHRLFAADDRNAIGDAMGLSDEQKDFLPLLQPGETVIYCGGWHAATRVQIGETVKTDNPEIAEEELARQGRQQLWNQRQRLYPGLGDHPNLDTPKRFQSVVHQGALIIELLLKINRLRDSTSKSGKNLRHKMSQKAAKIQQKLAEQLGAPAGDELCDVIGRLFGEIFSRENQELDCETFANALCEFNRSLADFDEFVKSDDSRLFSSTNQLNADF